MPAGGILGLAPRSHRSPDIDMVARSVVYVATNVFVVAEALILGVYTRRNRIFEHRNGFELVVKFT